RDRNVTGVQTCALPIFAALSGDPKDIERADQLMRELFPEDKKLMRWLDMASEKIAFQGLPSRIAWLGYGERAKMGLALNELVRRSEERRVGRECNTREV